MAKYTLITTTAGLAEESKKILKALGTMDKRIQKYLLSEIKHIEEHRNPTRLNDFFDAAKGKGARVTAMKAFILEFANVYEGEVEKDGKSSKRLIMRKARSAAKAKERFDAACEVMWTDFKPEGEVKEWSLEQILREAVAKAHKYQKEAPAKIKPVINTALLEAMDNMLESASVSEKLEETPKEAPAAANDKGEQEAA